MKSGIDFAIKSRHSIFFVIAANCVISFNKLGTNDGFKRDFRRYENIFDKNSVDIFAFEINTNKLMSDNII